MARPERHQELEIRGCLPPFLPTDETLCLAGKVVEGGLEGLEPAGEALRIDKAIGRRRRFNHRPGCWKQG